MIAILLVCALGSIGIFFVLLKHGLLIAFLGAALGGSSLAAAVAVVIARPAAKRRQSRAGKLPSTNPAASTLQNR